MVIIIPNLLYVTIIFTQKLLIILLQLIIIGESNKRYKNINLFPFYNIITSNKILVIISKVSLII